MRKLKIAGLVLLGVVVLFVLGGFLLSPDVELRTEAHLSAPPERVFSVLDTHEGQAAWWASAMQPHVDAGMTPMEVVHSGGPASGKGMRIDFVGEGEVFEEWEVLESVPPERIVYRVDFQMFEVERTLRLEPDGTGTKVTWIDTGSFDNPVTRYLTLMPSEGVIENFNGALVHLDEVTQAVE